jgi:hypothetical protein
MVDKPAPKSSLGERELDKAEEQFKKFDENVRSLTLDRMNLAPKKEQEPGHGLAQSQITASKDLYLKPKRSIGSREKFNEDYRQEYEYAKEYVKFIAENKMIIGEVIEMWTKPFPGLPAEEWAVPVNKPLWAPRYVAEQIKRAKYHVLTMRDHVGTGSDQMGQYYGSMAVDSTIQRLDATPCNDTRSIFMGVANA